MTVALATWEGLPTLGPDDRLLLESLTGQGVATVPAVWSDPHVRWSDYALVILRSTWDYHRRLGEFLRWVDRVARETRLFNTAPTVRWNSHKSYLRELERAGVPVVPTLWGSEIDSVTDALRRRGWDRAVLKPAVSASAEDTHQVRQGEPERNESIFHRLRATGEVLVQPYVTGVEDPGEHSLVFLDRQYSHAVLRKAALAPSVALEDGQPVEADAAELAVARQALGAVASPLLYARVDLARDLAGDLRVMELELIEPLLYLASRPGSAEQLADAIVRRAK